MTEVDLEAAAEKIRAHTGLQLVQESDDDGEFYVLYHEDGQVCGDSFDTLIEAIHYATVTYTGEP